MNQEDKKVVMPDGTSVLIRPITAQDAVKLIDFISVFGSDERMYMRFDSVQKDTIERQLRKPDAMVINRIVAERSGIIIGEATLELMRHGWLRHSAEIKMVVLPEYRETSIPGILAKEVFLLAAQRGIDRLITKCIDTQTALISIFTDLHFKAEVTLPRHAEDDFGNRHSLVLLTLDISDLWRDFHDMLSESYRTIESIH